ncbi:MAG: sensor histidine kinase [Cyanobacteria bacterium J06648_16]
MVKRPRSFRRLLLLRILLLTFPILLIGQAMTLRKARTSLLETARQNLTSSAIRKAEELEQDVRTVQSDLMLLSETQALKTGNADELRTALDRYVAAVPYEVDCLEIRAGEGAIATTTCDTPLLPTGTILPWQQTLSDPAFYLVSLTTAPDTQPTLEGSPITLTVAAPVYDTDGQLRYTLTAEIRLFQLQDTNPRSLVGDTVVIDSSDTLMIHPDPEQVGQQIQDLPAADRLDSILNSVETGTESTLHLFNFVQTGDEWLAGYSGARIPITPDQAETWNVLAVTPLNQALHALKDIRQILILLTLGLLSANALLALYVARSLSLPVERLIRYGQRVQDISQLESAPRTRSIWELDYLGQVLERMLRRLQASSQELRQAWKDAQFANQTKNEFLANTSHELRTPLNGIINSIRLVRNGDCDSREEELEFLEQADNASIHLLKIINDILDIAKIEAGTLPISMTALDAGQVLTDVLDLQSLQIRQKGLSLNRPDLSEPIMVQADANKLKQVLLNVIYNAVKFTHKGGITVEVVRETEIGQAVDPAIKAQDTPAVETLPTPSPTHNGISRPTVVSGPRVRIIIRDTGIGIERKQQHKLFRPFVMIDGSHTRRYEGTGLGLAISKNLMELMGGTISLASEGRGKGAVVTITLPLLAQTSADMPTTGSAATGSATVPSSQTAPAAAAPETLPRQVLVGHSDS